MQCVKQVTCARAHIRQHISQRRPAYNEVHARGHRRAGAGALVGSLLSSAVANTAACRPPGPISHYNEISVVIAEFHGKIESMIVRSRHTKEIIRRLRNFEVVAILGPRQIGKTTLAKQVAERYHTQTHHFDLEDPRFSPGSREMQSSRCNI